MSSGATAAPTVVASAAPAGAGAAAAAAGGGGKGAEILRHFTLENVAIGAGGRLIAASNGNRDGGTTLQLVRGR